MSVTLDYEMLDVLVFGSFVRSKPGTEDSISVDLGWSSYPSTIFLPRERTPSAAKHVVPPDLHAIRDNTGLVVSLEIISHILIQSDVDASSLSHA
jgi:hypothetical protein